MAELYARVCELSDPVAPIIRQANSLGQSCDRLRSDTLATGAMPGYFDVVLRYRRAPGFGFSLNPELT